MPYEVILGKTAIKAYLKLSPKLATGIDKCLSWLELNPKSGINVRKLQGLQGCYRYQVGGWRILYEVDDELKEVRIYEIRPRGDAYKH